MRDSDGHTGVPPFIPTITKTAGGIVIEWPDGEPELNDHVLLSVELLQEFVATVNRARVLCGQVPFGAQEWDERGKTAYAEYCETTEGVMHYAADWDELSESRRLPWVAAANAVVDRMFRMMA